MRFPLIHFKGHTQDDKQFSGFVTQQLKCSIRRRKTSTSKFKYM